MNSNCIKITSANSPIEVIEERGKLILKFPSGEKVYIRFSSDCVEVTNRCVYSCTLSIGTCPNCGGEFSTCDCTETSSEARKLIDVSSRNSCTNDAENSDPFIRHLKGTLEKQEKAITSAEEENFFKQVHAMFQKRKQAQNAAMEQAPLPGGSPQ